MIQTNPSEAPEQLEPPILFSRAQQRDGAVPLLIKLVQGVGSIPGQHKDWAFNTLLLLYYNQVMGLSASIAGLALGLSLLVDAVSDPLVGGLSDNFRSRFGRRHAFMLASAIPTSLSVYALFVPPPDLSPTMLAVWMITFTLLTRLSFTFFSVPWAAMAAELSEHYEERTQIMTYRIALGWLVGAIFIFCMYTFVFTPTEEHTTGMLNPAYYPTFGLILGALIAFWMLLTTLGTMNQVPYLPQPTDQLPPVRLRALFDQTLSALANRNFRLLFMATLLGAAIGGTGQVFDIYMNLYFWQLDTQDLRWFSLALLGAVVAFATVGALQRRFEKHRIMASAMTALMIMAMAKVGFRFMEVWPQNGDPALLPLLVLHGCLMSYGGSLFLIMFASMIADIVDEQEHITGMRQEGIFAAGLTLASKTTTGLGLFIGGLLLDWVVAMPVDASPSNVDADLIIRLGVVDGILVPAFYLLPILLISRYRLDRHQLGRLQEQIRQRKQSHQDERDKSGRLT